MQLEPIDIVNQTIQDGISNRRVREGAVSIIDDLERILSQGASEGIAEPDIEYRELGTREAVGEAGCDSFARMRAI